MTRRVLAIEDQQEIRDVIVTVLEATTDWSIDTVVRGADGVRAAGRYDVVLLDRFIPGEDAAGTIRRLRAVNPGLPVVLLTGDPLTDSNVRAIAANGLVEKPFDPATLADRIASIVGWPEPVST